MNDQTRPDQSNETIDAGLDDIKPSADPTPAQAAVSIARIIIAAGIALIAFIVAAAVFVFSHFKQ